jgi:hypothetical protein
VLSEHLLRSCSTKYVIVFANRSTKEARDEICVIRTGLKVKGGNLYTDPNPAIHSSLFSYDSVFV